ncbi:ketoacyl-ACP synthase III [Exilibacterium tricleocarpae]|uniref:Ketoacyl-ACP synthase III n=1 Tax=Exilibacterium tricleocarpae TaxID=2591008 RepID=A0A545TVQ6_9GAMM|nr:ketoacyl-ACP synthase III [Exilibacterium tricleocarpae]TQV81310.1 ketoacyl-ACP synthase III [Exilibacterium tricleocarpae]
MEFSGSSRIAGVGAYLPNNRVTSRSLMEEVNSTRFGTPVTYIDRLAGIKERRISDENMLPSDMAIRASENALEDAGVSPGDIDLVVYCGIDRDWQEPATAHRVQSIIGAEKATCFDLSNACHGFMNGLSVADAFIAKGGIDNALVCTGEKTSHVMYSFMERIKNTNSKAEFRKWLGSLTVGDAGGAMVVQRSAAGDGLRWVGFQSQGEHAELCWWRHKEEGGLEGEMVMDRISRTVVDLHRGMIDATYEKLDWSPGSADWLYCHQAGAGPHQELVKVAGMAPDYAPITYDYYGNLASATIPVNIALNRPKRGDRLLIFGAGSGISVCQAGMVF